MIGRSALVLAAVGLAAVAVDAQPIGSNIKRKNDPRADRMEIAPTSEARLDAWEYARCVVARQPRLAAQVIVANVDNKTIVSEHRELISSSCAVRAADRTTRFVTFAFAGDLFRYALADALVSAELRAAPIGGLDLVEPLDHPQFQSVHPVPRPGKKIGRRRAEELARLTEQSDTYTFLSRFGECVVRADPARTFALLMTVPVSPEEGPAVTVLGPTFARCLESGNRIVINRTMMRGTIAINYYRLAMAPRVQLPRKAAQ